MQRLCALAGVDVDEFDFRDNYARKAWKVRIKYIHINSLGDEIFTVDGTDYPNNQLFIFSPGKELNGKSSKLLCTTLSGGTFLLRVALPCRRRRRY